MKNSVFKTALITSIFLTMNLAVAAFATPIVIDFDTDQDGSPLSAGTEITNQYDDLFTLSVYSTRRGTQNAMIFDTGNYTGGDDDLDLDIGNAIIISEDGDSSDPDDEAGGGKFIFDFTNDITAFGFTILDIENPGGASITLFDSASSSTFTRLLSSFGLSGWGDSSVVAIAPFETSVYGFSQVEKIEIALNTSGAIGDVSVASVSEPATMMLFGIGLIGLAGFSYRRKVK